MRPVIVDENNEIVFEGIDFEDCFDVLRTHFMANMSNPGKYKVIDYDTGEKADYAEILRIRRAARDMINYGG